MKRDTEQFKHDYLPLQPAMQRMAERLLGNEDEAADVVQDCFVALWQQRDDMRRVVNREAWCIQLVKHRCIDIIRKRKHTYSLDDDMPLYDAEDAAYGARLDMARSLLDRLPERQAEAVRMRHFDDLDNDEIAATMGISVGNVYTLLSRAYNAMRQMIAKYEDR